MISKELKRVIERGFEKLKRVIERGFEKLKRVIERGFECATFIKVPFN